MPTAPANLPEYRYGFGPDRLKRLSELEDWHFWFAGRRALVSGLLGKFLGPEAALVLDLGCGTGSMVGSLQRQGHAAIGLDLRPEGLYVASQSQPQPAFLQADATHVPSKATVFDAILALDVLEHVDDRAALAEVHRALRPGGLVIITVPAIPWLWSYRDEAAGHCCRYSRRQLRQVLAEAQLAIQEVHYYQFFLLPLFVFARLSRRRGPQMRDLEERPPPILNAIFAWLNKLEARLSATICWPLGSSLVAVCRKEKE